MSLPPRPTECSALSRIALRLARAACACCCARSSDRGGGSFSRCTAALALEATAVPRRCFICPGIFAW